jgi:hypothetical protein
VYTPGAPEAYYDGMRAILLIAAFAACTTTTVPGVAGQHGACAALEGRTFTTTTPQNDCGLPAPGSPPATCNWTIAFETNNTSTSSQVQWQWSDVEETFAVVCNSTDITTTDPSVNSYAGIYDPASNRLVWNGVEYHD